MTKWRRMRMNLLNVAAAAVNDSQRLGVAGDTAAALRSRCFTPPPSIKHFIRHINAAKRAAAGIEPRSFIYHRITSLSMQLRADDGCGGQRCEHPRPHGRVGGRPALGDRLAFHPQRLTSLPNACFCPRPLTATDQRSRHSGFSG